MISWTDAENRRADYEARLARVGREGWIREAAAPSRGNRTRRMATTFGLMRRYLGESLVRAGERLQGTPAGGQIVDSAAV